MPDEVPLHEDIKDWKTKLTEGEKNLLTQIFRFFTQADVDVNDCYMTRYAQAFRPPEVRMMLSAFSAMETVHIAAYSHLLDTIGMPETEYSAFMHYKAMKDKHTLPDEILSHLGPSSHAALSLALFGAFTEGLQLFASFAMLLNFPRFNKMKGMGQIVTWSVRDESLHCEAIIKLYHTFVQENAAQLDRGWLNAEIARMCAEVVRVEDAFIDLAFEMGPVEGLTAGEVKNYIRWIANRRLRQLGCTKLVYAVTENPLPWMDEMLNAVEHANFFETRATEYSKAATRGEWGDVMFNRPKHVIIYTQQRCDWCKKAKELMDRIGLVYEEIDLTNNPSLKTHLMHQHVHYSVPMIFFDGLFVGGYTQLALRLGLEP
jgi:ribonucleoside-diphosphate reductase beta chain